MLQYWEENSLPIEDIPARAGNGIGRDTPEDGFNRDYLVHARRRTRTSFERLYSTLYSWARPCHIKVTESSLVDWHSKIGRDIDDGLEEYTNLHPQLMTWKRMNAKETIQGIDIRKMSPVCRKSLPYYGLEEYTNLQPQLMTWKRMNAKETIQGIDDIRKMSPVCRNSLPYYRTPRLN